MDLIFSLVPQTPFWKAKRSTSKMKVGKPREYRLEPDITEPVLRELVHFAYHRRCNLTPSNSVAMASISATYGINSLVTHCLEYLMEHCSVENVVKSYELACNEQFAMKKAQLFFQKYIEDHFEEVSSLRM